MKVKEKNGLDFVQRLKKKIYSELNQNTLNLYDLSSVYRLDNVFDFDLIITISKHLMQQSRNTKFIDNVNILEAESLIRNLTKCRFPHEHVKLKNGLLNSFK